MACLLKSRSHSRVLSRSGGKAHFALQNDHFRESWVLFGGSCGLFWEFNVCAPNELFSGPRGLGLYYPPKGKARRNLKRRRRPRPPRAPPEAPPAAGVRRRLEFASAGVRGTRFGSFPGPGGAGLTVRTPDSGPTESSRASARPASGWARGDSDSAFPASTNHLESIIYRLRNTLNGNRPSWSFDPAGPAQNSTNQGRLGGATLWHRDPKRRANLPSPPFPTLGKRT